MDLGETLRTARRTCDQLIAHGSGLAVYWYGGGELRFYTPAQAPTAWRRLRRQVTASQPTRGKVTYTAGIWSDDHDRGLLVLTGHRCPPARSTTWRATSGSG